MKQPQPGAETATGKADPELEGPDQAAHTLTRAECKFMLEVNSRHAQESDDCITFIGFYMLL